MLLDFEHQFVYYSIHILQNRLPRYIFVNLFGVFTVETPLRMYFCDVLESMVQVVIIKLQRTHCLYFLFTVFINTKCYYFLLVLNATILFSLVHKIIRSYIIISNYHRVIFSRVLNLCEESSN
jgi:hypothetical protein